MKTEEDLERSAGMYKLMANAHRFAAAAFDMAAAAAQTTIALRGLTDVLLPFEEWSDVVLEDILDAEVIGD